MEISEPCRITKGKGFVQGSAAPNRQSQSNMIHSPLNSQLIHSRVLLPTWQTFPVVPRVSSFNLPHRQREYHLTPSPICSTSNFRCSTPPSIGILILSHTPNQIMHVWKDIEPSFRMSLCSPLRKSYRVFLHPGFDVANCSHSMLLKN
jgi:hypothetical protein